MNSDPSKPAPLTLQGKEQARRLGEQLTNVRIDLAVATEFSRTQETIAVALGDRKIPTVVDSDFDEVRTGAMDGVAMEAYWSWKEEHGWGVPFPRGESVNDALLRYAAAIERVLDRDERVILVVAHEFGLRSLATAAVGGSFPLTQLGAWEHAVPYLFDARALCRAAVVLMRET